MQQGTFIPGHYRITVQGRLDLSWADCFGGFLLKHTSNGCTILEGCVADQAQLRGFLNHLWDLNLSVIEVHRFKAKV